MTKKYPKTSCKVTKRHRFLWWRWEATYAAHVWAYLGVYKHRECVLCGVCELYFGRNEFGESWRRCSGEHDLMSFDI